MAPVDFTMSSHSRWPSEYPLGMAYTVAEGMVFRTPEPIAVTDALLTGYSDVISQGRSASGLPVIHQVMAILAREAVEEGAVAGDGIVLTAESLRIRRAPVAGDVVTGRLRVESVTRRAGAVQTQVRGEILVADELPLAESVATMAFRDEDAES